MNEHEILDALKKVDPETRDKIFYALKKKLDATPEITANEKNSLYTEEEERELKEREESTKKRLEELGIPYTPFTESEIDEYFRIFKLFYYELCMEEILWNPDLIKEDSTNPESLAMFLKKAPREWQVIGNLNLRDNYQKILNRDSLFPTTSTKEEKQENQYEEERLRQFLGPLFNESISDKELDRRILLRSIQVVAQHWKKFGDFQECSKEDSDFIRFNKSIIEKFRTSCQKKIPDFEAKCAKRIISSINEINCSENTDKKTLEGNQNRDSFPWFNLLDLFDDITRLSINNVAIIFFSELDPDVWKRRRDAKERFLKELSDQNCPFITVNGTPARLNRTQADYLKVLIQEGRPLHYLTIWELVTGERIENERGAEKSKAQPGEVFKSKPEVKERYIKHYGKQRSGMYEFAG